ncbi:MAG: response regulator [Desulfobacter sp.]|nr:MAG: response regulator [Desulfobacter sp.]
MTYHRFTLNFTRQWAHLEPEFQRTYFRDSLTRIRFALLVGIFLYGIFGALDAVMAPAKKEIFWFMRYGVVIPSAAGILAFSFHPAFERWYQPLLSLELMVAGFCIEIMVILADPPANFSYYAGIILVFITTHTFFRIGFLWAAAASTSILIAYEIISIWIVDTPVPVFINNNFFFISSALLCIMAGYSIELAARQRFFSRHLLHLEKEKVSAANAELDSKVRERTLELSDANKKLHNEMKERLAAQEKRLELEHALNRRQKLESIGTLAGGIAHDFNNILAAIMGYTELIKEEAAPMDDGIERYAREVLKASQRAKDLTGQILTFSRQAEQPLSPLELAPVVREALKLLRASIPSTVGITTKISSTAWIVSDATQIHRVVVNLCTNAVQAIGNTKGGISVSLRDIDQDPETGWPASLVQLKIKDTGQGMTKEVMGKIFDPFFTTRDVDQGTGMGLSVVHGIVKKSGGRILVESEPGRGSEFTILIPRIQDTQCKNREDSPEDGTLPGGKGEHILVVDDEPVLIRLMETMLPKLGYRVTTFLTPGRALAYVLETGGDMDMVITDFSMPGMDGLEFASQVRASNPGIPILLCTGYSQDLTKEKMAAAGIDDFLMKPLTRDDLGKKIYDLLSRRG